MGGGNSKATTSQVYNSTVMNSTDVNAMSYNANYMTSNTIINQAKQCSASISQLQSIDMSNITVGGNFTLGEASQEQNSAITLDCVQASQFQNQIQNSVVDALASFLGQHYTTDALAQMDANAKSSGSAGAIISPLSGNSSSTSNSSFNLTEFNKTHENIVSTLQNVVSNNLSMNDIQKCISNVQQQQNFNISGAKIAGNVQIGVITQGQGAKLLAGCMQQNGVMNSVVNSVLKNLGVTTETTAETKVHAEMKSEVESKGEATGILQDLGKMLSGIFSGIFGKYAQASMFLSVCCILLIILMMFAPRHSQHGGFMGNNIKSSLLNNFLVPLRHMFV